MLLLSRPLPLLSLPHPLLRLPRLLLLLLRKLLLRKLLLLLLKLLLQSKSLFHFRAGSPSPEIFPSLLSFFPDSTIRLYIDNFQQCPGRLGEIRLALMAGNGKPEPRCTLRHGGWPDRRGEDPLLPEQIGLI